MKRLLIIPLLLLSLSLGASVYYVATDGNDGTGDGSIGTPWATWQKGFSELSAGDTLYIRGGTYQPTGTLADGQYAGVYISGVSGISGNYIYVINYPSEVPILDAVNITNATTHYGVQLSDCDYWHIKGLTVTNVSDSIGDVAWRAIGFMLSGGSTNITVEGCVSHDNEGPGFVASGCDDIYYLNCDSYGNYDELRGGENADGFVTVSGAWDLTVNYTGCRSWNNSDDGYDTFSSKATITYDRCWSFDNGYGTSGDGAAFKLGDVDGPPPDLNVRRTMQYCLGFNNRAGIDEGQEGADGDCISMSIYNCTFYNNYYRNYGFTAHEPTSGIITLTNNLSYEDGEYGDAIRTDDQLTETTNSWNVATVTTADFESLSMVTASQKRNADGSLPKIRSFRLKPGSDLIDAGTSVSLTTDTYGHRVLQGSAPDIGACEYGNYVLFYNGNILF